MPTWTVSPNEDRCLALPFLQQHIPAAPVAYLRQLLRQGKVRGAHAALNAASVLRSGDNVHLPESARLLELLATPLAAPAAVQILFESRELLVVDKPAGLAVHAGVGHEQDNLTDRVAALLRQRGDRFSVAPVQRLDLETSGPVLFGKGKAACGELGKLFQQRSVDKGYLALVKGQTAGSGELHSLMLAKGKEKEALATFRALDRNARASLLELKLHSGRQHQLRVQLAEQGHPLFGDRRYGGPCPATLPRLFLHCCRLAFTDPFSGARLALTCPLPDDLAAFLSQCQLTLPAGDPRLPPAARTK